MVTIETINGDTMSVIVDDVHGLLKIKIKDEDGNETDVTWLSKLNTETLAAVLSILAKQLD